MRKKSPPPDRDLRKPKLEVPDGACDCHFHVFGPQDIYPLHPNRKVDTDDVTIEDFLALQSALGFTRGLLVQSFLHHFAYRHLVHLLFRFPARLRGVAILPPEITDGELEMLDLAGVVGARFAFSVSDKVDRDLIRRVHELDWQPHYLVKSEEQALAWRDDMLASPGDFVIEHAGWQPPKAGIGGRGFRVILECLDTGRCWIKLSPRFTDEKTLPFADTLPFIHELVKRAPERMLWGSDWPHPAYFDPMPNDADLVDLLLEWVPDSTTRRQILVDNPAQLFGFPPMATRDQQMTRH